MVMTRWDGTPTIDEILAAARSRHRGAPGLGRRRGRSHRQGQYYVSGVVNGLIREALYPHPRRPRMALKIMPHGRL
jgi:hypothetical protein